MIKASHQQISHEKNHRSLLLRNGGDDEGGSCSRRQTFFSDLGFMELQKRRTRLLSLVEEVDRRYGHYCEKM
ncbi:hypothetical protein, partial [Streptomyces fildesensis]|uniref:hypothetical protein n=1 Tax=Streptomyces fildesensis TaxID=375757 RepID=UPI0018DF921D